MKKIIYFILFISFFLPSFSVYSSEIEYNTDFNIKKAILVENYIKNHKSNILIFIKKYNIKYSPVLKDNITELSKSITILQTVQNKNIEKEKAEKIIKLTILKLKNINKELKVELRNKKNNYISKLTTSKNNYSKLGFMLSNKIDNINLKIAQKLFTNNSSLPLYNSKIKTHLININNESKKLKKLGSKNFKSEIEIRDSFLRILKNIKIEIKLLKETFKKDI